jgi:hypothetical protein
VPDLGKQGGPDEAAGREQVAQQRCAAEQEPVEAVEVVGRADAQDESAELLLGRSAALLVHPRLLVQ